MGLDHRAQVMNAVLEMAREHDIKVSMRRFGYLYNQFKMDTKDIDALADLIITVLLEDAAE